MSFCQVTLIGNLGADPEIKAFQDGNRIANLRVATSESWRDKSSGERRERTEWHNVTIQGGMAKVAEDHLRKGSKIFLQGTLRTRKWQDRDGNDRYTTEIIVGFGGVLRMLDGKSDRNGGQRTGPGYSQRLTEPAGGGYDDLDDGVPF